MTRRAVAVILAARAALGGVSSDTEKVRQAAGGRGLIGPFQVGDERDQVAASVAGGKVFPDPGIEIDAETSRAVIAAGRVARQVFITLSLAIGKPGGKDARGLLQSGAGNGFEVDLSVVELHSDLS